MTDQLAATPGTKRKVTLAVLLAVLVGLLLTGCGGGGSHKPVAVIAPHTILSTGRNLPNGSARQTSHTRVSFIRSSAQAPTVGEVFQASTGTWANRPTRFAYQWGRCSVECSNILGATTASYTVSQADTGFALLVTVTATNAFGSSSQISARTGTVLNSTPPPPVNSILPQLSGVATQGQTLTTSTGTWTNSPASYAYLWQQCDAAGNNCVATHITASTYVLGSGDVGDTIRASVTASNSGGSETATTAPTSLVTATPSSTFGKSTVGATPGGGLGVDLKRVIQARPTLTSQVTKLSMYLSATGTVGSEKLRGVIYADSSGAPGALLGVTDQIVFTNTSAPGWYDLTLPDSLAVTANTPYWLGFITGGTASIVQYNFDTRTSARASNANTYTAGPSDPFGTASLNNEQFSIYATETDVAAPAKTVAPALTDTTSAGRYQQGDVISVSNGTWTNAPNSFAYQWKDCDSGGINCVAIPGATGGTYTLAALDIGDTIRATVTASNASGAAASTSAASAVVATNGGSTFAPTYVQSANCLSTRATPPALTGVTGLTCALNNNVTQGNLIVVAFGYRHASQTATVTDTLGSTFHKVAVQTATQTAGCGGPCSYPFTGEIWWASASSSGADTVTLGLPSGAGVIEQYVHEYNAANPQFDVASTSTGTGATITSGTAATNFTNETLFGYMIANNSVGVAGAGFTQREANDGDITEDRSVSATGSYAATATNPAADGYGGLEATFYGTGANAAVAPGTPTGVTAVASDASATVNWTPATTGGPADSYVITPRIAGVAQSTTTVAAPATSTLVSSLTNGTAYTFTVTATNSAGSSSASAASSPVTPTGGGFTVSCALTPVAGNDNGNISPGDGASGNCWGKQTGVYAATGCSESQIIAGSGSCGSGTFTHLSGAITATNGQVFNNDYITGCIFVPGGANNVQINNSLIVDNGTLCGGGGGLPQSAMVWNGNGSGGTNLSLTGDTIDASQGSTGSCDWPMNMTNATLLRVNAFGGEKDLNFGDAGTMNVQDSYFHAPVKVAGCAHGDVVFANGGNICCTGQQTFEHDYMEGQPAAAGLEEAAFVLLTGNGNSGTDPGHIKLDSSFVNGLFNTDSFWGSNCGSFVSNNLTVTNNVFGDPNLGWAALNQAWGGTNDVWTGNTAINNGTGVSEGALGAPGC